MLSFVDTLKEMLMLFLFVILLKKRQLDPRFQVGPKLLLLMHSNCEGRFFYYSSIEESIETQNGDFPPLSPDASRLPQRLGACRLPNIRAATGLDVINRVVEQFPLRHCLYCISS